MNSVNYVAKVEVRRIQEIALRVIPSVFCFYHLNDVRSDIIHTILNKLCQKYKHVLCYNISFDCYRKIVNISKYDSFNVWVYQSGTRIYDIFDPDEDKLDPIFKEIDRQCSGEFYTKWLTAKHQQRFSYKNFPSLVNPQNLNPNQNSLENNVSNELSNNLNKNKKCNNSDPIFINAENFNNKSVLKRPKRSQRNMYNSGIYSNDTKIHKHNIPYKVIHTLPTQTFNTIKLRENHPFRKHLPNINYSPGDSLHKMDFLIYTSSANYYNNIKNINELSSTKNCITMIKLPIMSSGFSQSLDLSHNKPILSKFKNEKVAHDLNELQCKSQKTKRIQSYMLNENEFQFLKSTTDNANRDQKTLNLHDFSHEIKNNVIDYSLKKKPIINSSKSKNCDLIITKNINSKFIDQKMIKSSPEKTLDLSGYNGDDDDSDIDTSLYGYKRK